ncbi:unnamed protein product [Closterium sp. Naga37s-1]|nr:unnamed protein product [Closterium sp. Naga37s-1]
MLREPLLPSTGGQESNTRATSDSAVSHEYRARVNLTIPRGAATASGSPPNRRASVDSANVTISEGSDLCAEADSRKRRISFGNERLEAGGAGRRGRWGSGGPGGGEGLRSPRSPGLSKQEVLGAFDAAEAEGEAEADLSAHLQTDFQTVLNTVDKSFRWGRSALHGLCSHAGRLDEPCEFAPPFTPSLHLELTFESTQKSAGRAFSLSPSARPSSPTTARLLCRPSKHITSLPPPLPPPPSTTVMVAVLFEFWGALGMCLIIVMVAVLFDFWGALGMCLIIVWPPLLSHVCPTHSLPSVRHVCVRQVMVAVLFEFWGALGMCLIIVWQSALIFLPPLPTLCLPSFATSAADASAPSAAPLCLFPRYSLELSFLRGTPG